MNVLIDMNLSPQWRGVLEKHGFSCVHWSEIGDPGADDAVLMRWALQNDHIVMTHDLDFGAILAATKADAPSVIQIRTQDVLPSAMEARLVKVLREYENELSSGALIIIDKAKSRVRILPLYKNNKKQQ